MNARRKTTLKAAVTTAVLAMTATGTQAQGQPLERCRPPDQSLQSDLDRVRGREGGSDRDRARDVEHDRARQQERDRIFGSELMSADERIQYLDQLRTLATEKERVEFRLQHHAEMQARAQRLGQKLDRAPARSKLRAQERARQKEFERIRADQARLTQEADR